MAVSRLEVPRYVSRLLTEAVDRSGYPIVFSHEQGIGFDSEVRVARPGQDYHEIAISPAYREFGLHFLVNGAFKIRRMWEFGPEDRYVPASEARRGLPEQDERELRQKLAGRGLSEELIEGMSRHLYEGLSRQLTSMPVDIRVEREIATQLPEHRPEQKAYLARQVKDLEPHFNPEIAELFPERLVAAGSGMNIVLAEEAAEIAGVEPGRVFLETPYRSLGERLHEHLRDANDPGVQGDRELTDRWAEELGLREWYQWIRMEDK